MKMIFKELYLFSPRERVGRKIVFTEGINVITSSQEDGTDRGKSVIMRSLYHALGAEAIFEKNWDTKNKIYILKFSIDNDVYFIYRSANLYKFFDADKKLIFIASKSQELAQLLEQYTDFSVQLPNRGEDQLEVAPPAYNYLPFFIDQDHYEGSKFASFASLGQYDDFKDKVLFYHFGVYDEKYFTLVKEREDITERKKKHEHRQDILQEMKADIEGKLEGGTYATDMTALSKEIELYRNDYSKVVSALNKSKNKLIELRNNVFDLELSISEIDQFSKINEGELKKLKRHICPECGTIISNTIELKSKRYNLGEDIVLVKNGLQLSLHEISADIEREECRYKDLLAELEVYESKLKINNKKVNDILRHKGLCEIRENIIAESKDLLYLIDEDESAFADNKRRIGKYGAKKKKVSDKYYELLISARDRFGLYEINPDNFKIDRNFTASGSNRNIATVIWYITVMKLRKEFNPKAIEFPAVFDSPNNVETDNVKKHNLLQYIIENLSGIPQLIISSIGFDVSEFSSEVPINIITLENDKYHLLDEQSYEENLELLNELCDASVKEYEEDY